MHSRLTRMNLSKTPCLQKHQRTVVPGCWPCWGLILWNK